MTKVSDCCGVEIFRAYYIDKGLKRWLSYCSKCHKPCQPVEKEGEDE